MTTSETLILAAPQNTTAIHRNSHLLQRIALLAALIMTFVGGARAQTATTVADGVYTFNNSYNSRGTMCYGTYNGTEYFALTDIALSGYTDKSVTVADVADKYWLVKTTSRGTYICNLGKSKFLQLYASVNASCDDTAVCGFTFEERTEGSTTYTCIKSGDKYLSFSCGWAPNQGQIRWLDYENNAAALTLSTVPDAETTYATQIAQAEDKIAEYENGKCDNPTISLNGWNIVIGIPENCTVYYTTDDTDPVSSATKIEYIAGATQPAGATSIKAVAVRDGYAHSDVVTFSERTDAPTYTFSEHYSKVTLTTDANTTYYYTLNGDAPSSSTTTTIAANSTGTFNTNEGSYKIVALTNGKLTSSVVTLNHRGLGVEPQASKETETYAYRIINTRRHTDNNEMQYLYPTDDMGNKGYKLNTTTDNTPEDKKQYWYLIHSGGYYYIVNRTTGEYLYRYDTGDDPPIELSATRRTRFTLQPSTYESNGVTYHSYRIQPEGHPTESFNPYGGIGNQIKSFDNASDGGSHWFFEGPTTFTRCATPTISLTQEDRLIEISNGDNDATILYTADDSKPEAADSYSVPISYDVYQPGTLLIAQATKDGVWPSALAFKTLEASASPTIALKTDYTKIVINSNIPDTWLYYTTDGTDPTYDNATEVRNNMVELPVITGTIKAFALTKDKLPSEAAEYTQTESFTAISTAEELKNITGNGKYYLTGDIALTDGTSIADFAGTLDGVYYTISGLTMPLFATTNGAIIKNIVIKGAAISGAANAGAIVGTASGATRIYNCGVLDGTIGGGDNVGGIAGLLEGTSRVINCYSFANITGGTTVGGIVGNNSVASTADDLTTLVANCAFYGDVSGGTNKYPIYGGTNISNDAGWNTYNYFRYKEGYTGYNAAQAIFKDEYLDRFEFYRRILNSQRELAAVYAFGDANMSAEIGKWTLDKDLAPYPIVALAERNTKETLDRVIPTTTEAYAGKKVGEVNATIVINGTTYSETLPITDMNKANWDYTYGKIVLPFANEFDGWEIGSDKVITGWSISTNDYYYAENNVFDNTNYVYAQGGNYVVPEGVTDLTLTAYVAPAVYLSDASYDVVYNSSYSTASSRGGATPTTYKGQTVHNTLSAAIDALPFNSNNNKPYEQAIVLVGNFHYNQKIETGTLPQSTSTHFTNNKPFTLMSADKDNDQEPDYCFYQFHAHGSGRTMVHPVRFDFVAAPGIGMAAHVEGGAAVPSIGIWHCKGWFELTETYLGIMQECEIRPAYYLVNSPWILNGGIFEEINMSSTNEYGNQQDSKLTLLRIGGKAYVNRLYPGTQSESVEYTTTLKPIYMSGGEVVSCCMTGKQPGKSITTGNVNFYCNGGYIHEFLGAYQEPLATDAEINIRADHALIDNFYGGGANENYETSGNINIIINNSSVNFFCGGPKFGNMSEGKKITITGKGNTFGEFYGGGYGGTALTRVQVASLAGNDLPFTADYEYPLAFESYTDNRLQYKNQGIGVNYQLDYFMYAGGNGKGVARFSVDYARLSLATAGDIEVELTDCRILGNYYGGGCQGRVEGNVTSKLNGCTVDGSAFAGGYTAAATPCDVAEGNQPEYSKFVFSLGFFTPFGKVKTEEFYWKAADGITHKVGDADDTNKILYTTAEKIAQMGEVSGKTSITITGNSKIDGSVFGGGNESKVVNDTEVTIDGDGVVINESVFGGGNRALVEGNTNVYIKRGTVKENVYGAGNEAKVTGATNVVIGR